MTEILRPLLFAVDVYFVNFAVVSLVEAFGHAQNDACATIGQYDEIVSEGIECQSFDFTYTLEVSHFAPEFDLCRVDRLVVLVYIGNIEVV